MNSLDPRLKKKQQTHLTPGTSGNTAASMPNIAQNPSFPMQVMTPFYPMPMCPPNIGPPVPSQQSPFLMYGFSQYPPPFVPNFPPPCRVFPKAHDTFPTKTCEDLFSQFTKKSDPKKEVMIWQMSQYFQVFHKLVTDLQEYVESVDSDTDDLEIVAKEIQTRKERILAYKQSVDINPTLISCLKYKISRRRRKRKLLKKKRLSKEKQLPVNEIARAHVQSLEQIAERVKQEEKLKQEANVILSSVMQKKADTKYHIQLLTNLLKLHSARVHQLSVEQHVPSDISISGVYKILEKLKNLWQSKLDEYLTEESGLKLMVKELAINAEDEECKNLNKTFGKWLKFIFGTGDPHSEQYYSSYDEFIRIRHNWDKYVVGNRSDGSKIPPGWVIPKYNENESWKRFLPD